MKPQDIKVGSVYVNRGKGRTARKVLKISKDLKVGWLSREPRPVDEPVVEFVDSKGVISRLYLRSFASWAGAQQ